MTDEKRTFHVAIIPDGNRRWAKGNGLSASDGHRKAGTREHLEPLLSKAKDLGITHLSLWAFSTENWKRTLLEREALFQVFDRIVDELGGKLVEEDCRFRWVGRRDRIPGDLKRRLEGLERDTAACGGPTLALCLDYGGRDEILRAVNAAIKAGKDSIDEEEFKELLDTKDLPDPDLIIRTSGEQRLSGFMPFQGTYAELVFTEKHFPEFGPAELAAAVEEFRRRQRRFGGG